MGKFFPKKICIFAKNFRELAKKHSKHLKIALTVIAVAIAVAWFVAWPMRLIDPDDRNNLLLTDGQFRPLKTTAPATLLYNKVWPDSDPNHGRILIRRPAVTDSLKRYPVVVVVQGPNEAFDSLAAQWSAMDSCYVMVMSRTLEKNPRHNGLLQLLDTNLSHWLNHCGMQVDANDVTLVDRTAQGNQAQHFTHRPVRHLLLTHAGADTACSHSSGLRPPPLGQRRIARRVHLLPASAADTACMAQTFKQFEEQELDADLYPTDLSPWHAARAIALDRHPISQTRLRFTHKKAAARGYDRRYMMFADFSIPSGKNRFFMYDYGLGRVIVASKCAHGCGSGSTGMIPQFSNEHGSCATSLGLYEIDEVHRMYKNGRIAINLEGLEDTNDNARMRGIKIHGGMRYEGEIHPRYLRLGKLSEGCFALSNIPLSAILILVEQTAPRHILLSAYTH